MGYNETITSYDRGGDWGCASHTASHDLMSQFEYWAPGLGPKIYRKGILVPKPWRKSSGKIITYDGESTFRHKTGNCGSQPRVDTWAGCWSIPITEPKFLETVMYPSFESEMNELRADLDPLWRHLLAKCAADWDIGTTLAEAAETAMLFKQVSDGLTQFVKTGLPYAAWLTWRYGVRPLIYDVEDALSALKKLNSGKPDQLIRRSSTRETILTSSELDNFSSSYGDVGHLSTFDQVTFSQRVSVVGSMDTVNSSIMIDPFTTAWELVPFSFVVDWFINVGEWLSALYATRQFNNAWYTYSEFIEYKRTQVLNTATPESAAWDGGRYEKYEAITTIKTRNLAQPSLGLPNLNVRLDEAKVMDLWSLYKVRKDLNTGLL